MSVGTPLREVPLLSLASTPRPQVPPVGYSDHLGAVSSATGLRPAGASPRPRSLLRTAWWTSVLCLWSQDSARCRCPGGLHPSALPCTCLGPGKNPKNRLGDTGVRGQVGVTGSEDRLGVMGIRGQVGVTGIRGTSLGVTGSGS